MKIVIIGDGKVGGYLANRLTAEGHDVTMIDQRDEAMTRTGENLDVLCINGNGAIASVQREAEVDECDLLIAATGSDELNMFSCLVAKKVGAKHTVARVRDPGYYDEIRMLADDLRLSFAINPDLNCANDIAQALRFPAAIKADTFAKGRIELLHFELPEGCILDGKQLSELPKIVKAKVLVCAVQRGEQVITPSGSFQLAAGDKVSFVASKKDAGEFFKQLHLIQKPVRSAMIIGGGRLGYYLARALLDLGFSVKVADIRQDRCEKLSTLLPGATILCGDGTDAAFLRESGVDKTDSFISATNIDEQNVLLSMYVRKNFPDVKVVTKVNRNSFRKMFETLDVGSIYDLNASASNLVVRYARSLEKTVGSKVETMYQLVDGKLEALEFRVTESSHVMGTPLHELNIREGYLIACINRQGLIIFPNGSTIINPGDSVIVVTNHPGLTDLDAILDEGAKA